MTKIVPSRPDILPLIVLPRTFYTLCLLALADK